MIRIAFVAFFSLSVCRLIPSWLRPVHRLNLRGRISGSMHSSQARTRPATLFKNRIIWFGPTKVAVAVWAITVGLLYCCRWLTPLINCLVPPVYCSILSHAQSLVLLLSHDDHPLHYVMGCDSTILLLPGCWWLVPLTHLCSHMLLSYSLVHCPAPLSYCHMHRPVLWHSFTTELWLKFTDRFVMASGTGQCWGLYTWVARNSVQEST